MSVGRDQRENIGQDVIYQVGRDQQEKYGKDHVHVVGNIHKQDIYADHLVQIGRNHEETVFGKSTLNVTEAITNNTAKHTLMAYEKFVIKGPGGKITLDASEYASGGHQPERRGEHGRQRQRTGADLAKRSARRSAVGRRMRHSERLSPIREG